MKVSSKYFSRKYSNNKNYFDKRKTLYLIFFVVIFLTVGYSSLNTVLSLRGQVFVKTDKIAPTVEYSVLGGLYNTDQSIEITPIDNESGVDYYNVYVYKDGVLLDSYENLETEKHEVILNENGTYEVRTFVVDIFGNVLNMEPVIDEMYYQTYLIDKEKPKITITPQSGSYQTSTNVTITVSDEGGSGLSNSNTYQYCVSSSETSVEDCTWMDYESGIKFTVDGTNTTKYLWVYPVKDNVGNVNENYTDITVPYLIDTYIFDSISPTLTVSTSSGYYQTSISITLMVEDIGGSGLSNENLYHYCVSTSDSNTTNCEWKNYTSGESFIINGENEIKYLWVYPVKDKSENVNDGKTYGNEYVIGSYTFDSNSPTIDITTNTNANKSTVNIIVADEGGSGLSSQNVYSYYLSTSSSSLIGGSWNEYISGTTFEVIGVSTMYIWIYSVSDNAGNVSDSKKIREPYVIKTITFSNTPSYTYTGNSSLIDDGNGNWRIKFLTDGKLTVHNDLVIDVFLVGGGGGSVGTHYDRGGSGGAGGYTTTSSSIKLVAGQSYDIFIGAGGSAGGGNGTTGGTGGTSSAFGYKAAGGGGASAVNGGVGGTGGSGGGGGGYYDDTKKGGNGGYDGSNGTTSGRSGGKGQGTTTREFGESTGTLYAGGGGGAARSSGGGSGTGGSGGGGNGAGSGVTATDGKTNTGGGGGGTYDSVGKKGGSGIVIIRNGRNDTDLYTYTGISEYVDQGDGNWQIKFLTSGTLTFKKSASIDLFLVGGGGGSVGSHYDRGGSGGAGGYTRTVKDISLPLNSPYKIVVGEGGAAGGGNETTGGTGGTSSAFGYEAAGGGGASAVNGGVGGTGGSGGGGGGYYDDTKKGGNGGYDGSDGINSGRSGGKGQGTTTREFGEPTGVLYAGGGGGAARSSSGGSGTGGSGGGGNGAGSGVIATAGETNTGGGGGGTYDSVGKTGGSGIVIIRNKR